MMDTVDYPGVRTTSGAHVFVHGDHAVKWAEVGSPTAERIGIQAAWLLRRDDPFLPRVTRVFPGGYQMERLIAMPHFVDDYAMTRVIFHSLRKLWAHNDADITVPFSVHEHRRYVRERAVHAGSKLADPIMSWSHAAEHIIKELAPVRVHGDPTWDNCMLRHDGELVLTDPIPPGVCLPSIRALDIAKVCQSVMGYEEVAFGRRQSDMRVTGSELELMLQDVDAGEWQVILYLTAVHFLRLLPYTPQHRDAWVKRITDLLEWRDDY